MFSKFFIERPVLSNVMAVLIMLLGVVTLLGLPVAQYPDITPPTVQVTTSFPGASPQVIIDSVAAPIEQQGAWQFAAPAWIEGVGHGLGSLVGIGVVLPIQVMAGQQSGMLGKPRLAGHGDQP